MTIRNVAIIGLGLLGGSIGLAIKECSPGIETKGFDANPDVRAKAAELSCVGQQQGPVEPFGTRRARVDNSPLRFGDR